MKGSRRASGLEAELARLKGLLGLNEDLKVSWQPGGDSTKLGEVRGRTIFIYAEDLGEAIDTLDHEMIDYVVSKAVEPYRQIVNSLIRALNDEAYHKKEEAVEMLRRLARTEGGS